MNTVNRNQDENRADIYKTVLYFGIFNPEFSRNVVYITGLKRNGVRVLICNDDGKGIIKYYRLFLKHWKLRNEYDAMVVGFPGYIITPFAKLIAKKGKPVIFDALCTFYETQIISRNAYRHNPFRTIYVRIVDYLATRFADKILVESEQQKRYFVKELGVDDHKCITIYSGVDEKVFYFDNNVKKNDVFTVLFRGRITAEAGVCNVLRAAKILENQKIKFLVIGFGWGDAIKEFNSLKAELNLKNLEHLDEQIDSGKLREMSLSSHISLGQFSSNERLDRTIPHKAYEAMIMRLPYITAKAEGICEILEDNVNCLMVEPENPQDIADKIMLLYHDSSLREKLSKSAFELYERRFKPETLVETIINLLKNR